MKRIISPGVSVVRDPVLVLNKTASGNLHWVTVVDVVGHKPNSHSAANLKPECKVIYNDSGKQTSDSCLKFVLKSKGVDDAWYTDAILPEYVHLVFEPIK